MEDSPLSTTANIAGILTFLAAIVASVTVRYTVLQHGYEELATTMESVTANSEEMNAIAATVTEGDSRPAAVRMRKLLSELYEIELTVLEKCRMAHGMPAGFDPRPCDPEGQPGAKTSSRRWASALWDTLAYLAYSLELLPAANYMVRDVVRDKIRQRDILRSQVLHQQIILLHVDICEVKSALSERKAEAGSSGSQRGGAEVLDVGEGGGDERHRAQD